MLEKFSKKHAEENAQQDEKQKDLESTAAEADNTVADEDDDADLFACIKDWLLPYVYKKPRFSVAKVICTQNSGHIILWIES